MEDRWRKSLPLTKRVRDYLVSTGVHHVSADAPGQRGSHSYSSLVCFYLICTRVFQCLHLLSRGYLKRWSCATAAEQTRETLGTLGSGRTLCCSPAPSLHRCASGSSRRMVVTEGTGKSLPLSSFRLGCGRTYRYSVTATRKPGSFTCASILVDRFWSNFGLNNILYQHIFRLPRVSYLQGVEPYYSTVRMRLKDNGSFRFCSPLPKFQRVIGSNWLLVRNRLLIIELMEINWIEIELNFVWVIYYRGTQLTRMTWWYLRRHKNLQELINICVLEETKLASEFSRDKS